MLEKHAVRSFYTRTSKDVARSEMMLVLLAMSMMRTLMTRVNVQSLKFSLQRCWVSTVKPAHDSIDTAQWIEHRIHLTAFFCCLPQKAGNTKPLKLT